MELHESKLMGANLKLVDERGKDLCGGGRSTPSTLNQGLRAKGKVYDASKQPTPNLGSDGSRSALGPAKV